MVQKILKCEAEVDKCITKHVVALSWQFEAPMTVVG